MKIAAFLLLVPVLVLAAASAQDGGEYKRWKLDIEYDRPDYVALEDALGNVRLVWYVTYKITNNTEDEVPLGIRITAKTDTKKTYRDSVAPLAQKALEKKTRKKRKNALDMIKGKIAPGKSIEAVAFLGSLDPNWDHLHVHFAGLVDPIDKVEGRIYFEKKVLIAHWYRPGDEFAGQDDPIEKKGEKWVIEGERKEIPQTPTD